MWMDIQTFSLILSYHVHRPNVQLLAVLNGQLIHNDIEIPAVRKLI